MVASDTARHRVTGSELGSHRVALRSDWLQGPDSGRNPLVLACIRRSGLSYFAPVQDKGEMFGTPAGKLLRMYWQPAASL